VFIILKLFVLNGVIYLRHQQLKRYTMKKLCVVLSLLIVFALGAIAFTNIKLGGILGKISPADAASSVSLVAATDTLKAQISQGVFTFTNLKEGVYTVVVKANAPYKDAVIEKVAVKDSATTDLGEIKLQQ
jgi:hypothetical protein